MNSIPRRASCALALLGVLMAGCSSADELKKLCIPTIDCAAIDTIETPANCSTCAACQDNWGACSPEGSVCKRGSLDLDRDAPGCESVATDARGQWLMHSSPYPVSFFYFNGGEFDISMNVSVLAYDEDDPSCIPTFSESCAYTVRAMQLEIPDFKIPESSWSGGVATLNGPVAALDDGPGASVIAPMLFAFDVQEDSSRRIALSPAPVEIRISRTDLGASIAMHVALIDFGGYRITDLYFNAELSSD